MRVSSQIYIELIIFLSESVKMLIIVNIKIVKTKLMCHKYNISLVYTNIIGIISTYYTVHIPRPDYTCFNDIFCIHA